MDLDFGLLQQINADIDGFPVRFDDDMDILDLDNVLHASVPGSFTDFAAWLAETESKSHPMSSAPNAACADASNTQVPSANPEQHPGASKAPETVPGVVSDAERSLPAITGHQQPYSTAQQQQQVALDAMRQNSAHSVHCQASPDQQGTLQGSGGQHMPLPTARHDSGTYSCSGAAAGSLLDPAAAAATAGVQQDAASQQQRQGSGLLAGAGGGWGMPATSQPAQQQQQQQQQVAAASAALSAAASKAQQLLLSSSSSGGFGQAAPQPAPGFLAAQQPQHTALSLGGAFPAISPAAAGAGTGGVLLSPHGAAFLQPAALLVGDGSAQHAAASLAAAAQHSAFAAAAGFPAFAPAGMAGMGLAGGAAAQHSLQYAQHAAAMQGYALHAGIAGHPAGHLVLHQQALHSLVGHPGVAKHSALERQQKARKRNTVASLEAELSDKLGQLQLLSAENEMLKLRAGVLEATVQNREDQMRVVWEHGPPTFPIDCPEGGSNATAAAALPGEQQQQQKGADEQQQPGAAAAAADGKHKRQGSSGLSVAGCGSSGQLASMWDDGPAAAPASAAAAAPVFAPQMPTTPSAKAEPASSAAGTARTASNCSNISAAAAAAGAVAALAGAASPSSSSGEASGGSDTSFDAHTALLPLPQQKESLLSIKRMTDVDVVRHWKTFLQEVTSALVQLQREDSAAAAAAAAAGGSTDQQQEASSGGGAVSPAEQRVRDLVDKACYLVRTSQTLNPSAYCRLFGRHLDTGETLPYNDSHWRNVVAVLGLSKDQVTHILACAELYFSSRAKLQAEQRALQLQLKAAELTPLNLLGGDADNPLRPWLERLGSNLKREHNLRIMLNSYVWGRIFTHVQKAKAAVYSHPLYVDIHALVCVMCEDALAAAGAPRGGSSSAAAQQQQQQQQQQHLQQQQLAAAYAACQQQQAQAQQQQLAGYVHFMSGMQHAMV